MPIFRIGGRNRPFLFGVGGLARLGKITGVDPQQYIDEAHAIMDAGQYPAVHIANLVQAGLAGGAIATNEQQTSFNFQTVTAWLDKLDRRELGRILKYIGECLTGTADVLGDWREQMALDLQNQQQ